MAVYRSRHGTRVTLSDDRLRVPAGFELEGDDEPPRGGPGSGSVAWRSHLDAHGVDYPEDAGRDELIAVWDDRG